MLASGKIADELLNSGGVPYTNDVLYGATLGINDSLEVVASIGDMLGVDTLGIKGSLEVAMSIDELGIEGSPGVAMSTDDVLEDVGLGIKDSLNVDTDDSPGDV